MKLRFLFEILKIFKENEFLNKFVTFPDLSNLYLFIYLFIYFLVDRCMP